MPLNPYINRKPTQRPDEFYGREQDARWLLERLCHPTSPQCCSITGLRRIGKSSLLRFMADPEGARARYPDYEVDGQRLLMVYADVSLDIASQHAENRDEAIAAATLRHMLRALRRRVANSELAELVPALPSGADSFEIQDALDEALYQIRERGHRVIFLLDEVDVAGSWSERLAYPLRALVMEHNIAYVTASLNPLHELLEEKQASVLYNMFSTHPLGLLDEREARALLTEPARALGVTWPDALTDALLRETGGHPDLIKLAGSHLWELLHEAGEPPTAAMVIDSLRSDARALFTSIWDHLDDGERDAVVSLATGRELPRDLDILPILQQRAVVRRAGEGYALVGNLFAEWVRRRPEANRVAAGPRLDGRWLFIDGVRKQLTPTEARLAEVLLEHRGKTVAREALQAAIWDEVDPRSKALDTTVQRLREKIEEDRANPRWLVTVRGEGYAFK